MDINEINTVHCFFEQSGTFKNEFKKLGIKSFDYDLKNEYGQTDFVIDLFVQIENAYQNLPSIFDEIKKNDIIFAFFPCIYFNVDNTLFYTRKPPYFKNKSIKEQTDYIIERNKNRSFFYEILLKFIAVCEQKNIKLIIENPYHVLHYLINNFPYKPAIIDKNRRTRGDYFIKPTMYYFINFSPTFQISQSKPEILKTIRSLKSGEKGTCSKEKSEISPIYARNFIYDFILGKKQNNTISLFTF